MMSNLSSIYKVPSSSTSISIWVPRVGNLMGTLVEFHMLLRCVLGFELGKILLGVYIQLSNECIEQEGILSNALLAISSPTSYVPTPRPNIWALPCIPSPFSQHTTEFHVNSLWLYSLSGLPLILVFHPFSLVQKHSGHGKFTRGLLK